MKIAVIVVAVYALAINLLAFGLFGADKRRAAAGRWRIRESTLLGVALAGGWLGAKAGQRRFRHKTRKQPFARWLNAAGLLQSGVLVLLGALALAPEPGIGSGIAGLAEAMGGLMPGPTAAGWEGDTAEPDRAMPRRFGPGSGDGM